MLDAAGPGDEAAIGQRHRVLYTARRDLEKARLLLLDALL